DRLCWGECLSVPRCGRSSRAREREGVSTMGRALASSPVWREWYLVGPYRVVYAALGLVLVSLVLGLTVPGNFGAFLCVLFLLAGLLAAGSAVWWRLRTP